METQGPFAVKLGGLEKEYARLQSLLRDLNGRDAAAIRAELDGLRRECRQEERLLEQRAAGCRLPAAAELARAQREWQRRAEGLLPPLERQLGGRAPAQGQAEAAALYAEFAIDLAAQSVRYALRAALGAMALQAEADEARAEEKALRG